jgi:radical SAM superfamily enzyme YgiQ (UPF0313 family)
MCDLAAISTFTAKSKDAYLLAERFRRAGVSTVIGGLNVTAETEEALEHCDAVVVGEGEVSWPRVSRTPSLASSPPRPAVHGRHQ